MTTNPIYIFVCLLGILAGTNRAMAQFFSAPQFPVAKVSAGQDFSMFTVTNGSMWTMGSNYDGQLGDNDTQALAKPDEIIGGGLFFLGQTPPMVTAMSARRAHAFFIESDGSAWAMGDNQFGEFGNGTTQNSLKPTEIYTNETIAIAAGADHALFLKRHLIAKIRVNTQLWAAGNNIHGQLGDGTTVSTNTPQLIEAYTSPLIGSAVTAIAAGDSHSLFVKSDGTLWAMGFNNHGQLGDGFTAESHSPEEIESSNVTAVAAAANHSFFRKSDGSLWAMGENSSGQLGNGTNTDIHAPAMIVASNVTAVAAGTAHTLFLKSDGSLWGMGDDSVGELNGSSQSASFSPMIIVASGVTDVSAGDRHSLFVTSDGSMWGMGYSASGDLAGHTAILTPVQIEGPLVANGGFETGDLLGWVAPNWISGTNYVSRDPQYVHSGNYGLRMPLPGAGGGTFSQNLVTVPGANYLVSFALNSDFHTPNSITAAWGGTTFLNIVNLPATGWTNFQFTLVPSATNTTLSFAFTNSTGFFGLDDVSAVEQVVPKVTDVQRFGTNLVLHVANGLANLTYLTMLSTNLSDATAVWMPVATNTLPTNQNFTVTLTNAWTASARQRFYMVEISRELVFTE